MRTSRAAAAGDGSPHRSQSGEAVRRDKSGPHQFRQRLPHVITASEAASAISCTNCAPRCEQRASTARADLATTGAADAIDAGEHAATTAA